MSFKQVAEKFCKHIEETQQNQFKDTIKNMIENSDDDYFMGDNRSTLSESICVLSPEDSYDVTTNQALFSNNFIELNLITLRVSRKDLLCFRKTHHFIFHFMGGPKIIHEIL